MNCVAAGKDAGGPPAGIPALLYSTLETPTRKTETQVQVGKSSAVNRAAADCGGFASHSGRFDLNPEVGALVCFAGSAGNDNWPVRILDPRQTTTSQSRRGRRIPERSRSAHRFLLHGSGKVDRFWDDTSDHPGSYYGLARGRDAAGRAIRQNDRVGRRNGAGRALRGVAGRPPGGDTNGV